MKRKIILFMLLVFTITIYSQETIVMEKPNNVKPISIVENGNVGGLNYETMNKLIKPREYKINISDSELNYDVSLLKEIDNQQIGYENSKVIYDTSYVILSKKNIEVKNLNEIYDKKIGVIKDSKADKELASDVQFYDTYSDSDSAFRAIANDKIDFLIVENSIAKYYLKNSTLKDILKINKKDIFKTGLCFQVKAENKVLLDYLNHNIAVFKAGKEYEVFTKDKFIIDDSLPIMLILIITLLVLIIVVIIVSLKFKVLGKISQIRKIDMNGTIFLKSLKSKVDFPNMGEFVDKIKDLQSNYPSFGVDLENGGNSISLAIYTEKKVYIKEEILDRFVEDLREAFLLLPEEQFMIQANIKGKLNSVIKESKFIIANNKNIIGIIKK